ncbi:hypothetical protein MEA186_12863 [Mesorhizobium amorphae CCNWGS0123]|uniref:Uncharacterized protein n=1 Tax=Mesorhizobium amorphae CCNWGS0123 TaxID=1082933 RepID=G6Y9F3_9HYPH|nr:hypothetical protein MEA186_12863 [Mesorhizobium amorphae CCNWGS0123]
MGSNPIALTKTINRLVSLALMVSRPKGTEPLLEKPF